MKRSVKTLNITNNNMYFSEVCVLTTLQDDAGHLSANRNQVSLDTDVIQQLEDETEEESSLRSYTG